MTTNPVDEIKSLIAKAAAAQDPASAEMFSRAAHNAANALFLLAQTYQYAPTESTPPTRGER